MQLRGQTTFWRVAKHASEPSIAASGTFMYNVHLGANSGSLR